VRDELAWYAERFRTVELNNPFYRLPEATTFRRWRPDKTPEQCTFDQLDTPVPELLSKVFGTT